MKTNNPAVIDAYETRIFSIQQRCLVLNEAPERKEDFSKKFEPALYFVSNPRKIWKNHGSDCKQAVLRPAISERLKYFREEGCSNTEFYPPVQCVKSKNYWTEGFGGA